jgi:ATP-binding cassette subfamily B protein
LEFSDSHLVQIAAPGPNALFTPSSLVQVARKIGLTAKLLRMSWSRLGALGQAVPAIIVLRNGEAVILYGIRQGAEKTEVVVCDLLLPTQGFQFWDRAKLEAVWDGDIILLCQGQS